MGLIRSKNTNLTAEDDERLIEYLWPIVSEMIKTTIENRQNLIVKGCYIPHNWREYFSKDYLNNINYICLVMGKNYINKHFDDIVKHSSAIESRLYENDLTTSKLVIDNQKFIDDFKEEADEIVVIDKDYDAEIDQFIKKIVDKLYSK